MQLYCSLRDGQPFVEAIHTDDQSVPLSAYPAASVILPYAGPLSDVELLGKPLPPEAVDLAAYAAARRYEIEISGVQVTVGKEQTVPMSTQRADRDGARDTLIAIMAGLRQDGAAFKFADGVSRAATNDEMKAAIAACFGHVQAAYDLEAGILARIGGKKPAITDIAGVDAAFSAG